MTSIEIVAWVAVGLASLVTLLTAVNLVAWPRGRSSGRFQGRVSALIPARNEEATIESCVRALYASEHPLHEVVVCNDHSTDRTGEILEALQAEFATLKVIASRPLPEGWVGKPHACAQLAAAASGDRFVYVDADTVVTPSGVARLMSLFAVLKANLVTAVPQQVTGGFFERLVLPLLHVTYTSWLPMPLVWLSSDSRFLAANGQVLAVDRATYEAIGGFEAVSRDIVDDMAFCRLAKEGGHRVVFADGHHIARCRMYESPRQVWEGFSKNIYEGIGGHPLALAMIIALYVMTYVASYVMLLLGLLGHDALVLPGAVGVGLNLALRVGLALRHRHPWVSVLLHPFGVLSLLAIAVNSFVWTRTGQLRWRGRTYAARASRVQ